MVVAPVITDPNHGDSVFIPVLCSTEIIVEGSLRLCYNRCPLSASDLRHDATVEVLSELQRTAAGFVIVYFMSISVK